MHEIKLGKFRIVRRLGRGGMGAVYEGHDPGLDRRVAIKTLTTEAIADQESRNRFEREARAAAKLQHPNIVTIYELGNFGGKEKPYIVMEYLGGADLAALIDEEEGLPFAEALDIAIQLLKALDFAHQCGVVHRDVKPSNVRYLDDGRVKIMDFGIARVEGSAQITRSGATVGTPYYMSPEQIRAEKIDRRSDIFSAGCILYEMLAGRRPFPGDLPSVFYKIVNEKPPPLVEQRAELPQEVQDILDRALAKEPGQRFQSAGEMAQELEKLLDVYRKSFPRPTGALRNRIEELERLSREDRWRDVIPLAEALVAERPELEPPRRVLRRALGEVRREEEERRVTAEERTRHLAVISQEIAMLYGPPAGVVSAPSRELKLRPETAASSPLGLGSLSVKLGIALMAVIVVAWILFPAVRDALGPKEMAQTVFISSSPSGAAIFVDGKDTGRVTAAGGAVGIPIEGLEGGAHTIEIPQEGYETAKARVTLGSDPLPSVELTLTPLRRSWQVTSLPSGAEVRLDGKLLVGTTPLDVELTLLDEHEVVVSKPEYQSRSFKIPLGGELPGDPIVLAPLGKPGTLLVRASYPLSVRIGRRELARASNSPSVSLTAGTHQITLYAPKVFLNQTLRVEIREQSTTHLTAPALGRVSVRASPENCTLTISGIVSEAPPFNNKSIVVGSHAFVFEWPDGRRDTQQIAVKSDERAYVTGRAH